MKDPKSPASERSRFRSSDLLVTPALALTDSDGIDAVLRELQHHTAAADRKPHNETDRVYEDLDER